jgi:uncharacterized alpha-E superfamily protein
LCVFVRRFTEHAVTHCRPPVLDVPYTERAENTARLLDVNYQTSLLPQSTADVQTGWRGLLSINGHQARLCGALWQYLRQDVMGFMVRDEKTLSIVSCLKIHAKTPVPCAALTKKSGEPEPDLSGSHPHAARQPATSAGATGQDSLNGSRFHRTCRGVTTGTMLPGKAYHFARRYLSGARRQRLARLMKFHAVSDSHRGRRGRT